MRKAGGPFVLRSAASAPPRALSDRRSSAIHAKIVVWFSAVAEQIGLGVQHSTDMLWPLVLSSRLLSATPRERRGAEPRGAETRRDATRCSSCCREAGGRRRHRTEPNRTVRSTACARLRRDATRLSFSFVLAHIIHADRTVSTRLDCCRRAPLSSARLRTRIRVESRVQPTTVLCLWM